MHDLACDLPVPEERELLDLIRLAYEDSIEASKGDYPLSWFL